ncbi:MAG: C40 family peptidase [Methylococcales bacterium]
MQEARAQLGKPYRWGGKSPGNGFDCSGLVFFTHRQAGLNVPRMSNSQLSEAKKVSVQDIQPGDLVFFRIDSDTSHVGIYIGGNEFIHAPSDGRKVSRESLDSLYWYNRLIAVGNFYR